MKITAKRFFSPDYREDGKYLEAVLGNLKYELGIKLIEELQVDVPMLVTLYGVEIQYEPLSYGDKLPSARSLLQCADIEPCSIRKTVYRSPEEVRLVPEKSFFKKLVNCWKYMTDKSGGYFDIREDK